MAPDDPMPADPILVATLAAALLAVLSAIMDRKRSITRLSYLPWDYLFVGASLTALVLGVRLLAAWLRA
jgi:hypothetical protein